MDEGDAFGTGAEVNRKKLARMFFPGGFSSNSVIGFSWFVVFDLANFP
jgi:hypothetical protein